jgi:catalase
MRHTGTSRTFIAATMSVLLVTAAAARGGELVVRDLAVRSFEETFVPHAGRLTNHTDRICAIGEFVGTPAAAALTRSKLFAGRPIQVVARFSVTGSDPSGRNAREMELELRLPDGSQEHMAMLNTQTFVAADPITFSEMIGAVKPDPSTGQPDEGRLRDFFASHPDAFAQSNFLTVIATPSSYADSRYFSVHTFRFIDAFGRTHFVRWRFIPRDGEKALTPSQTARTPAGALEKRFIARLAKGPLQWDMMVYVGGPGDTTDNATIAWPEVRRHFKAGRLTITRAILGSEPDCERINFDPLIVADGIAPTDDPILLLRSPAYAVAFVGHLSQALGWSSGASVDHDRNRTP